MILICDDQPEVRDYVAKLLTKKGHSVESVATETAALDVLKKRGAELELGIFDLDLGSGAQAGLEFLARVRAEAPKLPFIVLSGKGTIEIAVKALKAGASDFLEKDLYIEEHLDASLEKVRRFYEIVEENRRLERENVDLKRTAVFVRELQQVKYRAIGESVAFRTVLERAQALASIPRPVLIMGERGSGKELVAAAIHYAGERRRKPFVAVNCAAFHGQLLESEMFGHERGAFTSADKQKLGRFELADGGTLFLDEIGNMAIDFQEKVLRVIEYQEFERVGGTQRISVNVRVLAATNADLETMMEKGLFRRDLYDRLAFDVLRVPSLRERKEDIPPLVHHFAQKFAVEAKLPARKFTEGAIRALQSYAWPGNVRELKNVVERLVFSSRGDDVELSDVPVEIREGRKSSGSIVAAAAAGLGDGGSFNDRIEAMERAMLEKALSDAGGNQKKAAAIVGLTYDQFRHYYKKHAMKKGEPGEDSQGT